MKNPFGDQKIPGSYHNLKERMYKKVSAKVNDQMLEMMIKAYENALYEENIVLGLSERKRMLSQIVTMVMEDMLKKFDSSSSNWRYSGLKKKEPASGIAWMRVRRVPGP